MGVMMIFFSYLITAHCNEKNFFFLSPFSHPYFLILLLPKEKKEKEKKKETRFHIFSTQSNPIRSPNIII